MLHSDLKSIDFTPLQTRILALLSDGRNHSREEVQTICGPTASKLYARNQITILRKKLNKANHEILSVYVYPNKLAVRHVVSLTNTLVDAKPQ